MAFRIISLFSGIGGMDLGALGGFEFLDEKCKRLHTRVVLAVEKNERPCRVYSENLGPILQMDVEKVSAWPKADILIGGPPCQPFSSAGKGTGADDARNKIPAFINVLRKVRPLAFCMENVPALADRRHGRYLNSVVSELSGAGYFVEQKILQAANFGVPQTRQRLFVLGIRNDLGIKPQWPCETFSKQCNEGKKTWVTCRRAIADICFSHHLMPIRHLKEGQRRYPKYSAGARRQVADLPMFTITAQDVRCGKMYHPWYDRPLTVDELLRGMSFPDEFELAKPIEELGNAVPPILAHAVMKTLVETLAKKKSSNQIILKHN